MFFIFQTCRPTGIGIGEPADTSDSTFRLGVAQTFGCIWNILYTAIANS